MARGNRRRRPPPLQPPLPQPWDYGPDFAFEVTHEAVGTGARTGRLTTPHGVIDTPGFIFCGTKGALKGLTPAQAEAAGADIILANTYHLMIQPGADIVAALGGLHRMAGWSRPMLTDSGGYQIFSMGHGGVADEIKGRAQPARPKSLLEVSEEGARFRSYHDGALLTLTPEQSISIQRKLGADLIMQLDECTPFHVDRDYTAASMAMSHRWGDRCLNAFQAADGPAPAGFGHQGARQAMYGIIQGGVYADLRQESCAALAERPFFGTAIGGSLGADKAQMYEVVGYCTPHLPAGRPVHLLGIGGIGDIFDCVERGIDTFDCVHPTRVARHGWALRRGQATERINLRNAAWRGNLDPIDPTCPCATCRTASTGYLNHLIRAGEPLAMILLTGHNVATMARLMREIRAAIPAGTLAALRKEWVLHT